YAQFEARNGNPTNARQVYERSVEYFGDEHLEENLLIAFAKFEEQQKELCIALSIRNYVDEKKVENLFVKQAMQNRFLES
uniref:Uncharacterized protein n=1 Tax=Romanomermis culicivorax TaxID=13658 RepID=A0A915JR93_ROMCU